MAVPLLVAALKGDEEAGPRFTVPFEKPEGTLACAIDESVFGQVLRGTRYSGHDHGDWLSSRVWCDCFPRCSWWPVGARKTHARRPADGEKRLARMVNILLS